MGQSSNFGKWIGLMLAALVFVVFAHKLNAQTPLQGEVKPNVPAAMKAWAARQSEREW